MTSTGVGRVTIRRSSDGLYVSAVELDGVDIPHVRSVRVEQTVHSAPLVTLELVAVAQYVDDDPPAEPSVER